MVRMTCWIPRAIAFLLLWVLVAPAAAGESPASVPRLDHPGLGEAILEALAYLEDNQIRPRPGRGSSIRDSFDLADGARGRRSLNLPCREDLPLPRCRVENRCGEWASYIHPVPEVIGFNGRSLIADQDSNLFVTASVAYPLTLIEDCTLPPEGRFVSAMLDRAVGAFGAYYRHGSYNFWSELAGTTSPAPRVGPPNIPVRRVERQARLYLRGWFRHVTRGLRMPPEWWLAAVLDPSLNPYGGDALLNSPNDADDTALALAILRLHALRQGRGAGCLDLTGLNEIARHRDLNRKRENGRDAWKGKDTGAYLTWLRDEEAPTFAEPHLGVIPRAVNNVDGVVNANVALAVCLNQRRDLPGYGDCLRLLARVIRERRWPEAGIYYPNRMMFPYAVSRAWRDGGAIEEPLTSAMRTLLLQILDEQEGYAQACPERAGAFPGGEDASDHLATALGLCALLNLGRPLACELGQAERYERGVQSAADYLIRVRKQKRIVYASTLLSLGGSVCRVAEWESGLFFGSGSDLVDWRSKPITTAIALEALIKFAIAHDAGAPSRRLSLVPARGRPGGVALQVTTPGRN